MRNRSLSLKQQQCIGLQTKRPKNEKQNKYILEYLAVAKPTLGYWVENCVMLGWTRSRHFRHAKHKRQFFNSTILQFSLWSLPPPNDGPRVSMPRWSRHLPESAFEYVWALCVCVRVFTAQTKKWGKSWKFRDDWWDSVTKRSLTMKGLLNGVRLKAIKCKCDTHILVGVCSFVRSFTT